MNLLENMNHALAYIEEHLTGEIDYREAAKRALCSEYHFKRMFSFLAGLPLSEYVRRRRLTLAAFDLQSSQLKIIDIALNYGYSSPDAFTKAFQQFHGVLPSEARTAGPSLKSFPRMTFQLIIRGGNEMNYRIEEKEAFHIVGIKKRVPIIFEGVNPEISAMWQSLDLPTLSSSKSFRMSHPGIDKRIHKLFRGADGRKGGTGSLYRSGYHAGMSRDLHAAGGSGNVLGSIRVHRTFSGYPAKYLGTDLFRVVPFFQL